MLTARRWLLSPGLRVVGLALVLTAISLALVLTGLREISSIQGDAAWMNVAGSCRQQTGRILFLGHQAVDAGTGASEPVRRDLDAAMESLDSTLAMLGQGDPARRLARPRDGATLERLQALERTWRTDLGPRFRSIARGEASDSLAALAALDRDTIAYVASVDRAVLAYERLAEAKAARFRRLQQAFAATVLLVFLLLVYIVADASRRLRRLARAAAGAGAADAGPGAHDEIGVLDRALDALQTRHREAESRLRVSEERLARFLAHLPGVAFLRDRDGRLLWANDALERLLGIGREGWLGKTEAEVWPPAVARELEASLREFRAGGGARQSIQVLPAGAEQRHFLLSEFALPGGDGNPPLVAAVAVDITERRAAEEALRESEARYHTIVDAAGDGILTIDETGVVESANGAAERMFGLGPDELLGSDARTLLLPAFREPFGRHLAAGLETDPSAETSGHAMVGLRKAGTLFPIEVSVRAVGLSNRRVLAVVMRDLTARRRAESLAEIGLLASGLAHEIGTPMSVILGRAEVLRAQVHQPALVHGLDVIVEQVDRICRLMNQLLALARPAPIQFRPTSLNRVVGDALYVVEERIRKGSIRLCSELDESLPRLEADPDRLGQVVLNLAINALDAMDAGGTLTVRTALLPADARGGPAHLELTVADTGCGISPDDLPRIFLPFFTTKAPGRGTGLGLSLAQGIVHEHGGEILVESEAGRGTTFHLRLPVAGPRSEGATG